MLRIIGSVDKCVENVESDCYVPFSVRFSEQLNAHVNLWMLAKNNSLLEVAIDDKTGAIEYVTLVNITKEKIKLTNDLFSIYGEIIKGVPVCNREIFSENKLVREEENFLLMIGQNFLRIIISDKMPEKYYKTGRVYIGVSDQGELCEISMKEMVKNEIDTLKSCLNTL